MNVEVCLILKIIDGNKIGTISSSKSYCAIPSVLIDDHMSLIDAAKDIAKVYEIPINWLDLKQMNTTYDGKTVKIWYTSFVPKDFLNEEAISKISYDFNKFSLEAQMQIREALSLHYV
jgi:hypothetical protein